MSKELFGRYGDHMMARELSNQRVKQTFNTTSLLRKE
jgi:hypothetical protein